VHVIGPFEGIASKAAFEDAATGLEDRAAVEVTVAVRDAPPHAARE
jgi:hypothetical protein